MTPRRHFQQPEQEQRFVEAVTQGKQRAIATLEQALAQTKNRKGADSAYVAELERQLEARRAELGEVSR